MADNDLCETPQPGQQSVLNRSSTDKFILALNLPRVLKKTDDSLPIDPLQISVYGAIVPTIQVPAVEARFGGQSFNVSSLSRPNYEPLNVNIIIDNSFKNYWILWKWLSILNDPIESSYKGTPPHLETKADKIEKGNLAEYQTNFSILALNEYNNKIAEFIYYNAFITSLGGINYNYRTPDIIETTASFQFSQLNMKLF